VQRQEYYDPRDIFHAVESACQKADNAGEIIDYLSFVPDGEPTLDAHLRKTIELIKPLGKKIALITNSSLLSDTDVRSTLLETDWVSFKIDSAVEEIWRQVNRPHKSVRFEKMLDGMLEFKQDYTGTLVTETMLVKDVNDNDESLSTVAEFLGKLEPQTAYLSIPIRPPAESWVMPPEKNVITKAYQKISEYTAAVEYLIGYEGNAFSSTGEPEEDLLNITAVHPMREDAVADLLRRTGADWAVVERLIDRGSLLKTEYDKRTFYIRAWD
jgi:wyosine [tRNA(Phe)-imidazoG37] synthetase (radical SAM superfamily)